MVKDGAFSHKIDYVPNFGERGGFYLGVELHREGFGGKNVL